MATPERVRSAYQQVAGLLAAIQEYVGGTLRPYCNSKGYLFFDRIKGLESLGEKLESGRLASWSAIDDLYACTLVIPTSAHEAGVLRKLDACFERVSVRSRGTAKKSPETFRFDTTRYYGKLQEAASLARAPGIGQVLFEIQVATAFEYAWATVTHDLVYKGEQVDWKKQRLAAQLKAAVEQIEMIISAFDQMSSAVPESSWPEVEDKQKIVDVFRELISDEVVSSELAPASWRRFSDNVYGLVRSYSKNGYTIREDLSALLSGISAYWRGPEAPICPTGGSLFQFVLGYVARSDSPGNLASYTVVESSELRDLYEVAPLSKKFIFDVPGDSLAPD